MDFSGEVWEWRGPSPYYFVTVPEEESAELEALSSLVTSRLGNDSGRWVTIGFTRSTHRSSQRMDAMLVPLKSAIRKTEGIGVGDTVNVRLVSHSDSLKVRRYLNDAGSYPSPGAATFRRFRRVTRSLR